MYKEAKIAAIAVAAIMTACSGQTESNRRACSLYDQADALINDGQPARAIELLDSLQRAYPDEADVQRRALHLRPQAIEKATLAQLSSTDSLMAVRQATYEQLKDKMRRLNSPELVEPYYVYAATYNKEFLNTTGIEPRVSDIGQFYIVSSVNPGGLKHQAIDLTVGDETVSTGTVPYDGEMNYRIGGSEVITFTPARCDTIGMLAAAHPDTNFRITFKGEKKDRTEKLSAKQRDAIVTCYLFSQAIIDSRELAVQREKLERRLQIARDQIARTFNEDDASN